MDRVSASLDAADVGLRKVQKTVAAILGRVDAAIKEPERRSDLGADVDMLKDRLRAEIADAERDGVNWLTLDFGQDPQDKRLPLPAGDDAIPVDTSPILLISSADAADGILTRPYGASEDLEFGGYHLLSDDASYGQELSREISIADDVSDEDLKGMRAALASITAGLAGGGARLDAVRWPNGDPVEQSSGDKGPMDIGKEIDALLASVTRDALRAQALNIMNSDGAGLKRLLAS
ncbi:hypothetical protein [Rhizobium sp. G21]|uniref:hypothetical protein n=1 Tax=Rhizobium sp. G21 TaxID=2758439 RepID=UPI00160394C8|nr:hypothetical protein [Rhizobium sp. G21]MBB1250432.1 hypothetical protein [Rhizobium sp. G21]